MKWEQNFQRGRWNAGYPDNPDNRSLGAKFARRDGIPDILLTLPEAQRTKGIASKT